MTTHVPGKRDDYDEMLYGFFHLDDPRDFFPDDEESTPEELAAHKEACAKAEAGEPWTTTLAIGLSSLYDNGCQASPSFGIGSYVVHQEPTK